MESETEEQPTPRRKDVTKLTLGVWLGVILGLMALFMLIVNQGGYRSPTAGPQDVGQLSPAERIDPLREILAEDPDDVQALIALGFAYIELRDAAQALPNFEKAQSLEAENIEALVGLGMAYEGLGRFDEALPMYERALGIDPDNDFAKARKAYFLAEIAEEYESALAILRELEAKEEPGSLKEQIQANITEIEGRAAAARQD
jgi:tetratricopeptide (TPR) repeat protein